MVEIDRKTREHPHRAPGVPPGALKANDHSDPKRIAVLASVTLREEGRGGKTAAIRQDGVPEAQRTRPASRAWHAEPRLRWRAMRDSDENYTYSIGLHGPTK